jgi:hypothetical protein
VRRLLLALCFLLTPAAILSLLLATRFHATLLDCVPEGGLNDEIHYWTEISGFAATGFQSGYYVPDERPAPLRFCHFGAHGPAFPMLYGGLARVVGWYPASGPLFNVWFLLAGSLFWILCCQLDAKRLLIACFLMATFWPCLFFIPATLQESLHCSIAFVLAGLVQRMVNGDQQGSFWPFLLTVALASTIRVTWILVLVPYAYVLGRQWWKLACMAAVAFGAIVLRQMISAPFPNYLSELMTLAKTSPALVVGSLLDHLYKNVDILVSPHRPTLEVLESYIVIGMVLPWSWFSDAPRPADRRARMFCGLNLAMILMVVLTLYDVDSWKDYRVLAPHLLLSLLVLLSSLEYRRVIGIAVIHLLFVSAFLGQFDLSYNQRVRAKPAVIEAMQRRIQPFVAYDKYRSSWQNTVLAPVSSLQYPMLGLPPGIGISSLMNEQERPSSIQSRWLLLPPLEAKSWTACRLRFLQETPLGNLYLNLDAPGASDELPSSSEPSPSLERPVSHHPKDP